MRGVELTAPGQLSLRDFPSRPLQPHEVRIRVMATYICGSDLKNIRKPVKLPQIPGHEFSGAVLEVSTETQSPLQAGDRVTAFPMLPCMSCRECQAKNFRDCGQINSLGFQLPGCFAEEVIVNETFVVPLSSGLSFEQGALVEHLACGYRIALEVLALNQGPDTHIVIVGDGPVAIADVQALKIFEFKNITVVGKHESRLNLAGRLGATRTLTQDFSQWCTPIDICIHAAPADETLEKLLPFMNPDSTVFPQTRILSEKNLRAIESSGIRLGRAFAYHLDDFRVVMELIEQKRFQTDLLITTRLKLDQVSEALSSFYRKKDHFKTLITP